MPSSSDQSLKDALECPVCKDLFSEPKQLDCGHTYCLKCVNALDRVPNIVNRIDGDEFFDSLGSGPVSSFVQYVQNNVQCPQCRKMCQLPDAGLSTNYTIKDMVEKFRETFDLLDDDDPPNIRGMTGASAQTKKEEQYRQCNACTKKVADNELFICKDCNKPIKKQLICALCVVRSHKQHTVVTLDSLANAREREMAAMRIEEILAHAHRVTDETRNMQNDITKQFETTREKFLAKLNTFYVLQNECLDNEQNALKEEVEGKVYEAIHKCEQLNEHFLRLRELKTEFEAHLKRWQDELTSDVPSFPQSSPPPLAQQLYFLRSQFGGSFIPAAAGDQQQQAAASSSCAHPRHFVFTNGSTSCASGGANAIAAGLIGPASSRSCCKKAQPILVAHRRRSSRLRGAGGGATSQSDCGNGGGASTTTNASVVSPRTVDNGTTSDGTTAKQSNQERDLFSFFD